MKIERAGLLSLAALRVLVLSLACLALPGCGDKIGVTHQGTSEVAALDADDIVLVMRRAGFSDEQIVEVGTDVRNSLATAGTAKIHVGKRIEAILVVSSECLYISSYHRGNFIYDLKTKKFR